MGWSKVQWDALMMLSQKGVLERWDGGFWTYKGCPTKYILNDRPGGTPVPEWHCGARTLRVLERDCRVELNEQKGYCRLLSNDEFYALRENRASKGGIY